MDGVQRNLGQWKVPSWQVVALDEISRPFHSGKPFRDDPMNSSPVQAFPGSRNAGELMQLLARD